MKFFSVLVLTAGAVFGAPNPIHWSLAGVPQKPLRPGASFSAKLVAVIDPGWHLYAMQQEDGGPTPLDIGISANDASVTLGVPQASKPASLLDPNFNKQVNLYLNKAQFRLPLSVASTASSGSQHATIQVHFQSCNDVECLPPRTVEVNLLFQVR